jgi:hypothetical protein
MGYDILFSIYKLPFYCFDMAPQLERRKLFVQLPLSAMVVMK